MQIHVDRGKANCLVGGRVERRDGGEREGGSE